MNTTLKYALVLTIAMLCNANATAKADVELLDTAGTAQLAFEHFSNVDTYWGETKLSNTFRLADADSHFTSFSLDLSAAVDVWWKIYNTVPTELQAPDGVYARFYGGLYVNGNRVDSWGYDTDGLTFGDSGLVFSGKGDNGKDVFEATGEDAFTSHLDIGLSGMSETNELTVEWKLEGANFFDFFPLLDQAGYTQSDYCAQWLWEMNGLFDIAWDSTRNEGADVLTPEPASMLIFGIGISGMVFANARRRKK